MAVGGFYPVVTYPADLPHITMRTCLYVPNRLAQNPNPCQPVAKSTPNYRYASFIFFEVLETLTAVGQSKL